MEHSVSMQAQGDSLVGISWGVEAYSMATVTDPAREIADFCRGLAKKSNKNGDQHIAEIVGVEPWSYEFLEVLTAFRERTDFLLTIIDGLPLDLDQKAEFQEHVRALQRISSKDILAKRWDEAHAGGLSLTKSNHTAAVSALSASIRPRVQYPKLTDEETKAVLSQVDGLLSWLEDHQLSDHDFIRHALILGLKRFRVRLERVNWLGWDCAHEGLREVVAAYMALEREFPLPDTNPNAGAMLKKTKAVVEAIWEKAGQARDAMERVDLIVRVYGWTAIARDANLMNLLTHG